MSTLSVLDKVVVGDSTIPFDVKRLDQLGFLLIYSEILIRIQRLGGQGQRFGVVLAPQFGDQFGKMTWLNVIIETELMLK